MMQSTLPPTPPVGLHVGIIMDGNGRWAEAQGLSRSRGHAVGARTIRAIVEAAPGLGIGVLTLYAFSADNWKRPPGEVRSLMRLLRAYLRSESERCAEQGVRLEVIGRRDRLAPLVVREMVAAEGRTGDGERLLLRLAVDYSAREAIVAAALASPASGREFRWALDRAMHARTPAPDVDLLIRTGAERRLSDFMLWECAYAELVFLDTCWPDFGEEGLAAAIREFRGRDRRFGSLSGSRKPTAQPATRPVAPPRATRSRERTGSQTPSGTTHVLHSPRG